MCMNLLLMMLYCKICFYRRYWCCNYIVEDESDDNDVYYRFIDELNERLGNFENLVVG